MHMIYMHTDLPSFHTEYTELNIHTPLALSYSGQNRHNRYMDANTYWRHCMETNAVLGTGVINL